MKDPRKWCQRCNQMYPDPKEGCPCGFDPVNIESHSAAYGGAVERFYRFKQTGQVR